MVKAVRNALEGIDIILWIFDAERGATKAEQYVYEKLQSVGRPVLAVINKIDKAAPEKIEEIEEQIQKYGPFKRIIKTSAKTGEGVAELINTVREFINEGPFLYNPDTLIDKPTRFIISELIREKIYRYTSQEIPYETGVYIEYLSETKPEELEIRAEILVNRETQKGILIGKNAEMIRKIRLNAKKDIAYTFDKKIQLELYVRVKENWARDGSLRTKDLDFESLAGKKGKV
jgi:GTP-binding protein Era